MRKMSDEEFTYVCYACGRESPNFADIPYMVGKWDQYYREYTMIGQVCVDCYDRLASIEREIR